MFRCESCGKTFEELEHYTESHGFEHPPFEEWDGCPYCGESRPTEVESCAGCGELVDVEELYDGFCVDCLKKNCTYDNGFEFLLQEDLLGPFFCWLLNGGWEPHIFESNLLDVFQELYKRKKANDLLLNKSDFLESVQEFILDADGHYGKDNFADFLKEKEGGKKQ